MKRQELEIYLSRSVNSFTEPKFHLEQYQTPPRVAANLLHRANELGDIMDKTVLDLCAGTGILGIGAGLLSANVTFLEIDSDAIQLLNSNLIGLDIKYDLQNVDAFSDGFSGRYDTVICNPPFGIQQKKFKDLDFVKRGLELAQVGYFILDGSIANIERLPKILEKNNIRLMEYYLDEFPLAKSYPWHKLKRKIHQVMVIRVAN